jgi:predicted kinase
MKNVIVGIGIPGSGKTTLLKQYAEENGWLYVSPDDLRNELTGNTMDHSKDSQVWTEAYARVGDAIRDGRTVVIDATFGDDRYRQEFLEIARKHGAQKIEGVYVDTSLETAKERNAARERVVPEYAIERIHQQLQKYPPKLAEGFDALYVLGEDGHLHEIIPDETGNEIKRSLGKLR